jgi:anti-anti-sigma factor
MEVWEHLEVVVSERGAEAHVYLAGELDMHTAGKLARHLGAIRPEVRRIVLDLNALEFMDSLGLGVVLSARTRAQSRGADLVIGAASPAVERLLELAGVGRLLLDECS